MKSISILGSTGFIGCSTIDLITHHQDQYSVKALVAQKNVDALVAQAKQVKAKMAVVADETLYQDLKDALEGTKIKAAAGPAAVIEATQMPSDLIMSAIVGTAGLRPTWAAIERGATIALANKETMISAGNIILAAVQKHKARLLPVDS